MPSQPLKKAPENLLNDTTDTDESDLHCNVVEISTLVKHLFDLDTVTTTEITKINEILLSLEAKGVMKYRILYNQDCPAESLVITGVEKQLAHAYYNGQIPWMSLSKTVN